MQVCHTSKQPAASKSKRFFVVGTGHVGLALHTHAGYQLTAAEGAQHHVPPRTATVAFSFVVCLRRHTMPATCTAIWFRSAGLHQQ
jgi:hypothetical protein